QATFSVELGPDIETCGGSPIILDAETGVPSVTYQWFFNGVLIPGAINPTYTVNPPNSGNYMVEATDNGCTISDDVDINFLPQPIIASPPQDIDICNDGTNPGIFDLTENDDDVRGGQDPLFNITYHRSQLDASTGANPIIPANAYLIVGSSETIWVQIEEATGTCFAIDSFEITYAAATATPPASPFYICDLGGNGQEPINLNTTFDAIVLNGQSPLQFTVPYHINPSDAISGNTPFAQPYLVTGSVFIFIRVESNTVSSCYAITQVNLVLAPQPVANPAPDMYQCDYGNTNGTFILTDNDDEILGAQDPLDFTIRYFETQEEAILGLPGSEIPGGIKLIDLPSPERVWARIEDSASGTCFDYTHFDIYFSRAIAGDVPDTMNFCDANGDGQETIDLEAVFNPTVLDGQPSSDYDITYHLTQADADGDTGALAIPHTVLAPSQIIYIRLENRDIDPNGDPCVDTTQNVTITLDLAPTVHTAPPQQVMCDDNNDGFATFELPLQDLVITQGDLTLTVTYHRTLLTAESNTLELPDLYINDQRYLDAPVIDPLDINYGTGGVWARVSRAGNSCVSIVPFALEVRFSPVGTTPEPLRLCDDAVADGITRFDLTVVRDEVLGSLDPLGFDLYYYEDPDQAVIAGDLAITPAPDFSQAIPDP